MLILPEGPVEALFWGGMFQLFQLAAPLPALDPELKFIVSTMWPTMP